MNQQIGTIVTYPGIIRLRASALPLAFICPGSIRECSIDINESSEPAANGRAAHKSAENLPRDGTCDWKNIANICAECGADENEVRLLSALAQKLWPEIRDLFPCALTEIGVSLPLLPNEGLCVTGTMDLVSIQGTTVRILDWKFGWRDYNYGQQMLAYLALVLLLHPQLEEGTSTVAWVRDQQIETYHLNRKTARAWEKSLVDTVVNWDGQYHPGDHCVHCRRHFECQAANAIARSYVAEMANIRLEDIELRVADLPEARVIDLYDRARMVSKIADGVLAAIKMRASKEEIVFGNEVLAVKEEKRRHLDVIGAWPLLQEKLTTSQLGECVRVSLTDAQDCIARNAGRGNGKAAKDAFSEEIEKRGLVQYKPLTKLQKRRI